MSITVTPQEARTLKSQNFVISRPPFSVGSDMMVYHNPKTGQEFTLPLDPYSMQHYTRRGLVVGPAPAGLVYTPDVDLELAVTEGDAQKGVAEMAAEEKEAAAPAPTPPGQPTAVPSPETAAGQLSLFDYIPETDNADQAESLDYMLSALPSATESRN